MLTITRRDIHLHAGIDSPICGWDWIEGRRHPLVDCEIRLVTPGFRSTVRVANSDPKVMREVFRHATR